MASVLSHHTEKVRNAVNLAIILLYVRILSFQSWLRRGELSLFAVGIHTFQEKIGCTSVKDWSSSRLAFY